MSTISIIYPQRTIAELDKRAEEIQSKSLATSAALTEWLYCTDQISHSVLPWLGSPLNCMKCIITRSDEDWAKDRAAVNLCPVYLYAWHQILYCACAHAGKVHIDYLCPCRGWWVGNIASRWTAKVCPLCSGMEETVSKYKELFHKKVSLYQCVTNLFEHICHKFLFRHSYMSVKTIQILEYIWIFIQFSMQIFILTFIRIYLVIPVNLLYDIFGYTGSFRKNDKSKLFVKILISTKIKFSQLF